MDSPLKHLLRSDWFHSCGWELIFALVAHGRFLQTYHADHF
jgi:hypothetical protein